VRQRRSLLGMSQTSLGNAVIQKYERGSNRIGASRLYEFAKVLDVPVPDSFFSAGWQVVFRLEYRDAIGRVGGSSRSAAESVRDAELVK